MPFRDRNKKIEYQRRYFQIHKERLMTLQRERLQHPDAKRLHRESCKRYRVTHKELIKRNRRNYLRRHRLRCNAYGRKVRRQLRREVIVHFGGKCVHCGMDDWRALQVDHIEGGGRKRFTQTAHCSYAYYKELLKATPGVDYQLLCANCNQIKKYENGETQTSHPCFPSRHAQRELGRLARKVGK